MKRIIFTFACYLLFIGYLNTLYAQNISQRQLSQKMQLNGIASPNASLFVHFDKTIYTNNETVWFTGYILNASQQEISHHQVLSVALVRDIDSLIIKQDKYFITNGISFGSLALPDSMITGNYHFQVTTNRVRKGKPDLAFIQPIVIKTNIDPAFNAGIKLLEPGILGKKPNQVLISLTTRDGRFLPKPAEITYKYGKIYRKAITNASGELLISISEQIGLTDPNIYAKIKYGNDSSFVNLPLPVSVIKARIGFYPEGGNLIDGIPCNVAWEVKDQQGGMVSAKATLYKDNQPIENIETNSYGIGQFKIAPSLSNQYFIKLINTGFADSIYRLPAVMQSGISLNIKESAVKDTLLINLSEKNQKKVIVRLHDFVATYFYKELDLRNSITSFKIPLKNVPKGLKTITVFDTIGRPLAERMIFAHYDPQKKIDINTDQQDYGQRQKVTIHLKLNGMDSLGLVSVACVQDNRLLASLSNDIETYVYLKQELNELPSSLNGVVFEAKDFVENVLLTKGWRKYTWSEILKTSPADTLKAYDPLAIKIKITRANKELREPIQLAIMNDKSSKIETTTSTGEVTFDNEDLLTAYGKKIQIAAIGRGQQHYKIKIDDPYQWLNRSYLKLFTPERNTVPSAIKSNNELTLSANERVIRLKEVKIKSKVDNRINYTNGKSQAAPAAFGGCPYHPYGPGPGETCGYPCGPGRMGNNVYDKYGVSTSPNGGAQMYQMMYQRPFQEPINQKEDKKDFMIPLSGIYTKKEFYVNDFKDTIQPAFVSTLYWNHGTLLDSKGQDLVFYTSDIIGKFRVVVQGITDKDLIYGQQFFEVKGKDNTK